MVRSFVGVVAGLLGMMLWSGMPVAQAAPAVPPSPSFATAPGDDTISDAVGATAGSFNVDQQGNAEYQIPVFSPHGAGGLSPSVALSYNSGSGDGLLGYGWSVGGVSSITPCRATQEHGDGPGEQSAIQLDPKYGAVYCLDGERMVLIQGPNGAVGAQYRLEHDNQTLIVIESVLPIGSNPTYWTLPNVFAVYAKDGTVRRYGGSTAQLSYSPNFNAQWTHIAAWYQYELRDSNNNVVTYSYLCYRLNGSSTDSTNCSTAVDGSRNIVAIAPYSITWSGGEIDFNPTVRPAAEQTSSDVLGFPVTQRYRIATINVKSGSGTLLRSYNITSAGNAATNSALRQVTQIQECVGSTCFAPTKFQWDNLALGGGASGGQSVWSGSSAALFHASIPNVKFGDIDGDGRADVVWMKNDEQGQLHAMLMQPTSAGISLNTTRGDLCATTGSCPTNAKWGSDVDLNTGENYAAGSWQLLDFNGDGRSDLLTLAAAAAPTYFQWQVSLSNGNGFAAPTTNILLPTTWKPGDALNFGPMPLHDVTATTNAHAKTFIADYDGDGLPDLLVVGDYSSAVYLLVQTGSTTTPYAYQGPFLLAVGDPNQRGTCGVTGSTARSLRVADFNGDGRADIVVNVASLCTNPTGGAAPTISSFNPTSGNVGSVVTITGTNFNPAAALDLVQFNGATAAVKNATASTLTVAVPSGATTGPISVTVGNYTAKSTTNFTVTGLTGTNPAATATRYLQVLTSKGIHDNFYFYFAAPSSAYWPIGATPAPPPGGVAVPQPLKPDLFQVIDLNGDGLADIVFGALDTTSNNNSAVFYYQLNNGVGNSATPFATAACVVSGCPQNYGASQFNVGDYDGDGKGDVWIVPTDANHNCLTANCEYTVYEYSEAGFGQSIASPLFANDINSAPSSYTFQLDFDGDGYADTLMINPNDSSLNKNWGTRRLNAHHQARNVISQITSGLGAVTSIDYAPLTFSSVYYREYNGWQTVSGWGAAVQDVLTPRYVVQYVDSSAPTISNTAATSRVRYRYGGYKVQGFGRGPLGFHTLYTTDQQTNTETVTTYNQAYPLTGTPQQTVAYKNADSTADACLNTPDAAGCMLYNNPPPTFAGVAVLSKTTDTWAWHPRGSTSTYQTIAAGALTTAIPIDLMHAGSTALKYGLDGALLSSSAVSSTYGINSLGESYGELTASTTSDYSSATQSTATLLRQTTISNQYAGDKVVAPSSANSYQAVWHLGRLSNATTTATPWVGGVADSAHAITRVSTFDYDTTTGLLTGEHLQPSGTSDQALHKYHFRDAKGNETQTVTCSASAACSATTPLSAAGMTFKSTDATWVQRYTRTAYDANGIYPTATYAPFSNGSTGATEYTTLNVLGRDAFGNITDSTDVHGVETRSYFGALGRQYFSTSNTGGAVQTIYRWCSGHQPSGVTTVVNCPAGAAYRVDSLTNAGGTARAPETWTYFDVLAREVLKVQQGFAATQYIAVHKDYDNLGRVAHVTEPYFTYAPTTTTVGNANGVTIYQTTTGYDVLGRVTSITHPNNSQTTTVYSSLDTTVTLPANASNIKETKKQTNNLLGQLVTVTDYYGSTLTHTYDVTGNVLTVKRASSTQNATVTMTYDALGRKKSLSDPDLGNWTYSYNALGEQVQSKSSTSCTNSLFDGQGRLYSKSDYANGTCTAPADVAATWSFDTVSHGVGELASATSSDNGTTSTRTPAYDSFGRTSQVTTAIGATSYTQRSTYDQFGRPYQGFFAGTNIAETGELYGYNAQGYAYQTQDGENGTVGQIYRQITALDARGNATTEVRANNATLTTTRTYDPAMGWLTGINTASGTLQNLTYTYDALGNQQTRSDTSNGASVSETFTYDGLQRLLSQSGSTAASWSYDSFGNPTGATYGTKAANCTNTPGPDAISATSTNQYCYDTRGNQTSVLNSTGGVLSTATYTADDKLRQAATQNGISTHTTQWAYGPERARLVRLDYANATATGTPITTHYLGDAEIVNAGTATPTVKRYLPGLILSQVGATITYEYLFTDNLGSTHRITDQSGTVYTNGAQRFTAFGQRASTANDAPLTPTQQYTFSDTLTHHGYTGHEQMDESGLIHMNGRIYAPGTMRFTSPDPFVQDPSDIQSYNRYSYVLNNPLVHTDPSGYWGRKQQGYTREAAAIAISVVGGVQAGAALASAGAAQAAAVSMVYGYTSGFVASGGNLKGAVLGALSASVNFGIGGIENVAARVATHAAAGGVLEVLNGGKFGHGFVSAGLGSALNPIVPQIAGENPFAQGITASVLGGAISQASGGKFANGALSAAFQYAFNDLAHDVAEYWGISPKIASVAIAITPGAGIIECLADGCGPGGWAGAAIGAFPAAGELKGAGVLVKSAESLGEAATETTRVGRWMSQAEYDATKTSGKVQESFSGTTHVASPADASAFINQAKPGSLYVEFNVPTSSLKTTGEGWAKVIGPNSLEGRLAIRKGLPIPQMPEAKEIVHSATKLP